MKKLLSIGLAAMLAFGLATTSFAATDDAAAEPTATPTYTDVNQAIIKKVYAATNSDTISPAETFNFTIERTDVSDAAAGITKDNMPLPTIGTVEYVAGEAGSETKEKKLIVNLDDAEGNSIYRSVGVYTYTITETPGTTAGVTYHSDPIILKVTVIEQNSQIRVAAVHTEKTIVDTDKNKKDTTKSDKITNTYSAGKLTVSKVVTGKLGDKSKKFDITVTFTSDKEVKEDIYDAASTVLVAKKTGWTKNEQTGKYTATAVLHLANGDAVTFKNIPYDVTYEVTESNYTGNNGGYDTPAYSYSDTAKKIDSAEDTVTVTNNKDGNIDTGVVLNNMPYILVLAVLAAGVAVFIIRKRRED